jgi:predicted DCC family thiol-disulfide oxidoreductase YuxK
VPPTDQHPIILFDGVCVLCSGSVRFVIARDPARHFRFASMQSPAGQAMLRELGLPLATWESAVLVENGVAYRKSAAILRIARHLSGLWPALAVCFLVPRLVRDWAYDAIARNRYRIFGRLDACMVPTPGLKALFIETIE